MDRVAGGWWAGRGARRSSIRSMAGILAAVALTASGFLALGMAVPRTVAAAASTPAPTFTPGRHVYDYGNLMSAKGIATAEALAAKIEAAGGGRVVVYTADLLDLPDDATLAKAWGVDGLLLAGWDSMGTPTLGPTLTAKLSTGAAKMVGQSSPGPVTFESWATSTLARTEGLMRNAHVFDGAGALDPAGLATAEAAVTALATRIGATVYVDIAIGDDGNPATTAFFNGADWSSELGTSLIIALAVSGNQIGGYIDSNSSLWDSYETHDPWTYDSLSNESAPNGDVQAELLRAIDAVRKPPDPAEAATSVATGINDAVTGFFADPTNRTDSALGALAALVALVCLALDRRRRRREPGYADDESVMVPGPPADMTPALAALVAFPLDTTRAVTVALLDLAAHGYLAFYSQATPLGYRGGIKLVSATGSSGHAHLALAPAASRPLGPAEQSLLEGLQAAAGGGASISPTDFAELRPLFEQIGEQLERVAGQRGWLRMVTRSVSRVWVGIGAGFLAAAVAWGVLRQPVAIVCEALAGLIILPRATRMPLPLVTPDGAITSAMVEAYRRTLRRALAGAPGQIPPWLANAEEAALWGYAWGLEGEVQSFVGRNVGMAMAGQGETALEGMDMSSLRSFTMMMGTMSGTGTARPVGLDTDAISATLNGLGRSMTEPPGR